MRSTFDLFACDLPQCFPVLSISRNSGVANIDGYWWKLAVEDVR